jgi:2-amino-4-hydroxy-6-hydroxymethyldihydropteridine diphosphokinase
MRKALALIAERVGERLTLSGFYETAPWGYESAGMYLNAVVGVETGLSPFELLDVTQAIERVLGREEKTVNGRYRDRVIDIDILLYDLLILHTPRLTIPHPQMLRRPFVMQPLLEIAPEAVNPLSGKTVEASIIR